MLRFSVYSCKSVCSTQSAHVCVQHSPPMCQGGPVLHHMPTVRQPVCACVCARVYSTSWAPFYYSGEALSGHCAIKPRLMECCTDTWLSFSPNSQDLCSSLKVTIGFSLPSFNKTLLFFILVGWPALGSQLWPAPSWFWTFIPELRRHLFS